MPVARLCVSQAVAHEVRDAYGLTPTVIPNGVDAARFAAAAGRAGASARGGHLWLTDREDDVVVRGGERVHPVEVERVLEQHPAVRSAAAYGVPDEECGQRVEAVADVGTADVDGASLRAFAATVLDAPRRPAVVHVVRSPVRDDPGTVRRRDLPGLVAHAAAARTGAPRAARAVGDPSPSHRLTHGYCHFRC